MASTGVTTPKFLIWNKLGPQGSQDLRYFASFNGANSRRDAVCRRGAEFLVPGGLGELKVAELYLCSVHGLEAVARCADGAVYLGVGVGGRNEQRFVLRRGKEDSARKHFLEKARKPSGI